VFDVGKRQAGWREARSGIGRPMALPARKVSRRITLEALQAMAESSVKSGDEDVEINPPETFESAKLPEERKRAEVKNDKQKKKMAEETKARISASMAGRKKSEEMKNKVSQALKGRVPWNKGKKLAVDVRNRMSSARFGRAPWNKGQRLTEEHKRKISKKMTGREISEETRRKLKMASKRPGDEVLVNAKSKDSEEDGNYSLVDTEHIHEFVTLRGQLRIWSDEFSDRIGRKPSISDVRRLAPLDLAEKFERYLKLRDRIRGLAKDVYGLEGPQSVPVQVPSRQKEPRIIRVHKTKIGDVVQAMKLNEEYDDADEKALSKNDFRMLGKYRLMESHDIHSLIQLRKELKSFSDEFKRKRGRIPALSDIKDSGQLLLYNKFETYLTIRGKVQGLAKEVYGLDVDNLEEIEQVSERGQKVLEKLRKTESADNLADLGNDSAQAGDASPSSSSTQEPDIVFPSQVSHGTACLSQTEDDPVQF